MRCSVRAAVLVGVLMGMAAGAGSAQAQGYDAALGAVRVALVPVAEFPWNVPPSPYAALTAEQAGSGVTLRWGAGVPFRIVVSGVDPVATTLRLTIAGVTTDHPSTPDGAGEVALGPRTQAAGSVPGSVVACHEFSCSTPLEFTLVAVPAPSTPSGIRLGQVVSASLKAIAEALDVVIAERQAPQE